MSDPPYRCGGVCGGALQAREPQRCRPEGASTPRRHRRAQALKERHPCAVQGGASEHLEQGAQLGATCPLRALD